MGDGRVQSVDNDSILRFDADDPQTLYVTMSSCHSLWKARAQVNQVPRNIERTKVVVFA